ncbi:MoaD/ThiS family protein [Desulfatitalea alkaliphila]|uniref:MoaD/ThiS family protein n=1 Tax=Desulfatitalea alkaliphila TaxID=2929485 RepID=UPI003CCF489D
MTVSIRCFAGLAKETGCDHQQETHLDEAPDATVESVMASTGISPSGVHMIFLNGRRAAMADRVHNGDRLAFVPPVGGM